MMLDIFPDLQARAVERAQGQPLLNLEPRNAEMFNAATRDRERSQTSVSEQSGRFDVVQERMERFRELTGRALQNPEGHFPGDRDTQRKFVVQQFEQLRQERPGVELTYPGEEELSKIVDVRAREALRDRQILEERNVNNWTPWWAGVAGDMVGFIKDPVNQLAALPGLFTGSFSILGTALFEAGLAAVSETAVQTVNFGFRKRVDQSFGVGDAVIETGEATAFGFVLGGVIRSAAGAWHSAKSGVKTRMSRRVKDAANVVTREAITARGPHAPTLTNEGVHRRAVQKASEDLTAGRPVELPPEAFVAGRNTFGRVYDAEGRDVGVQYEVVEASSLVTSHNRDLRPNPDFPVDTLQPRFRDRPISQDQINSISSRLQPERLGPSIQADSGAPIIGGDNLVESGNGRVLALRKVYERDGVNAENYRNFLRSMGHDVDGFNEPVLIARRITPLDPDERVAFVNSSNRSTAMRLSATEQALADARFLDEALISNVDGADLRTARNRNFVRGFLAKLPRSEQGSLIDGRGSLSQDGERRLLAALMARAYGDPAVLSRALEATDSNIRAIAGALADAAPDWVRMKEAVLRGEVPPGMDITDDVLQAVRSIMRARDAGRPLKDFLEQAEMFGGPSEIAKMIGAFMFRDADLKRPVSRGALTKMLRDYSTEARKNTAGPRLLGDPLETEDVLNTALRNADREDLINRIDEFAEPERADELARADETEDQVIALAESLGQDDAARLQARQAVRGFVGTKDGASFESKAADAVSRFGDLSDDETVVFRGFTENKPPARGEQDAISTSADLKTAESFALARNEDVAELQGADGDFAKALPIAKIVVPPKTRFLDVSSFLGKAPNKEAEIILGRGKLVPDNTPKERFRSGDFEFEVSTFRFEPDDARSPTSQLQDHDRIPVTIEDENGNRIVESRSLRELLDEADEEIEAGKQIEICLTGGGGP